MPKKFGKPRLTRMRGQIPVIPSLRANKNTYGMSAKSSALLNDNMPCSVDDVPDCVSRASKTHKGLLFRVHPISNTNELDN
jgi:hypothetical protein